MLHAEYSAGNPLTGRRVWLVRHIIGDKFGDPWDWSVVVVKTHFLTRTVIAKGAMDLSRGQIKGLSRADIPMDTSHKA